MMPAFLASDPFVAEKIGVCEPSTSALEGLLEATFDALLA